MRLSGPIIIIGQIIGDINCAGTRILRQLADGFMCQMSGVRLEACVGCAVFVVRVGGGYAKAVHEV